MLKTAILFGVGKGTIMSVVLASLDIEFWKQVVIVTIGGIITASGVVIGAIVSARSQRETRDEISHVKRALGADRRLNDQPERHHGDVD